MRDEAKGKVNKYEYYRKKVTCINDILCKNTHPLYNGLIFDDLKKLYIIINLINTQYDELSQRGFSSHTFYDFFQVIQKYDYKETTGAERMNLFLGILNGTMKFYPKYEVTGYQIVPKKFNKTLIKKDHSRYAKEYMLESKTDPITIHDISRTM